MWRKTFIMPAIVFLCMVLVLPFAAQAAEEVQGFEGEHPPIWDLKAKKPFLIGGYGDNFNYDGSRVSPLLGKARVIVDAVKDSGTMVVSLKGTINPEKGKTYTGKIKMYYTVDKGGPAFREGGVADFIYLHGDTKQGPPVMPKVRSYVASWGRADVYVNDELVYKGLDGHMMYTERSRDVQTKAIYNKDKSGFYSHKDPANSSIAAPHEAELHFVAHSEKKDTGNFPPHSVWIHVNFERVKDKSYGAGWSSGRTPCGIAGCGCGCAQGGPCGCGGMRGGTPCGMHGGKAGVGGGTPCGIPGCGCGCAQGGPCGCGMHGGKAGVGGGAPCGMHGGKAGVGGGAPCGMHGGMRGGAPCGMHGGMRGGTPCDMHGGMRGGAPCGMHGGMGGGAPCGMMHHGKAGFSGGAPCGPGCGCGCVQGGPCSCPGAGAATPCGIPGCDCGCAQGGPCKCN
jgi:hypothetical protein